MNWRPNKWKKKKSKGGQKLRLWVPPCVFIYKNAIELWVMEIENSQNVFSVSITHNSKIRELSDRNRVMKIELSFAKQPFCYGSHYFWVMSYENWELSYRNCESKQPLSSYRLDEQCKLFCVVYFISTKPSFMRQKK